jgi:hypothetical protein
MKILKENFDTTEHQLHCQDTDGSHSMTVFQTVFGWITDLEIEADGNTIELLKVDALHCL